ncbi:L domain-like protein [Atractiella rhizophila]|nr:L domain-like protein [Atractiella rhizophila]
MSSVNGVNEPIAESSASGAIRLGAVTVQGNVTTSERPATGRNKDEEDSEDSGAEGEGKEKLLDERAFEDQKRVSEVENGDVETSDHVLAGVPLDSEDLELTHARIKTLKGLDFRPFTKLKRICLRQNEIPTLVLSEGEDDKPLAPLSNLPELEEIDLYDNKIKEIGGLDDLPKLTSLDLSFNLIKKINGHLSQSSLRQTLTHLYFVQNKISRVENLSSFSSLTYLELGGNRLRKIENLSPLAPTLTMLWLGKNKITSLAGLEELVNLKTLSVQSNRLTEIGETLRTLTKLEELYLSHNGLTVLDGLEENKKLTILDCAANKIATIAPLSHLTELEDFWANDNKLSSLDSLPLSQEHNPNLSTIYLEGNPLQREEGSAYRRKVMLMLPQVKQIDATYVRT